MYETDIVKDGDTVLLYFDDNRKFVVKIKRDGRLDSDRGYIVFSDVIGKPYGSFVETNLGFRAYILKPLLVDFIEKFRRITQIIYPKDLSYIVFISGITPGSIVVEAGTGSGVLTATLANFVRPDGKVYTYEVRKEFLEVARRNVELAGLGDYVVFKNRDVRDGIEEKNVDAVFYDLPTPWSLIDVAYEALKPTGSLTIFVPTIEQLSKTIAKLREHGGFINIKAFDTLVRSYKTIPGEIRPNTWAVIHTGYIINARKILKTIRNT